MDDQTSISRILRQRAFRERNGAQDWVRDDDEAESRGMNVNKSDEVRVLNEIISKYEINVELRERIKEKGSGWNGLNVEQPNATSVSKKLHNYFVYFGFAARALCRSRSCWYGTGTSCFFITTRRIVRDYGTKIGFTTHKFFMPFSSSNYPAYNFSTT